MNGQKAVSIAQVGQVYFDEWVSITSAATPSGAKSERKQLLSVGCGAFDVPISKSLRRSSEDSSEHMGTHALERESCVGRS